ncbi:MAG: crosslink repair DNA glycosylase YcaQ family protein [Chloroflexota bacterium]
MTPGGGALNLRREEILAYRRGAQSLDERLPWSAASLRRAASAGLQDSMPRAALLSIHARVTGTTHAALDDPALVQVWGPRYSAYVVAAGDHAPFTLGRLPDDERGRRRAEEMAKRVQDFLDGRVLPYRELAQGVGVGNAIRYATTTGTLNIRWEGARAPTVWSVPRPTVEPLVVRIGLARRYLHAFGPTDADAFSGWAGVSARGARAAFEALAPELVAVTTPIGDRWILAADESALRAPAGDTAPARLLPSGDTYFLLWDADRELLVPEPAQRERLWTSRVWPGAVLVDGQIVGTWRRAKAVFDIEPWRTLTTGERQAVEAEAASLPLPGLTGDDTLVRWGAV